MEIKGKFKSVVEGKRKERDDLNNFWKVRELETLDIKVKIVQCLKMTNEGLDIKIEPIKRFRIGG